MNTLMITSIRRSILIFILTLSRTIPLKNCLKEKWLKAVEVVMVATKRLKSYNRTQ